jgi:hypothetical protein
MPHVQIAIGIGPCDGHVNVLGHALPFDAAHVAALLALALIDA